MKQKLKELRENLQRWKSHNEVNAKPADQMLYNVLDGILKLGEGEDEEVEDAEESADVVNELESFVAPAADEDDSNPPGHGPGTPP